MNCDDIGNDSFQHQASDTGHILVYPARMNAANDNAPGWSDSTSLLERIATWRRQVRGLDRTDAPFDKLAERKQLLAELDQLESEILRQL